MIDDLHHQCITDASALMIRIDADIFKIEKSVNHGRQRIAKRAICSISRNPQKAIFQSRFEQGQRHFGTGCDFRIADCGKGCSGAALDL